MQNFKIGIVGIGGIGGLLAVLLKNKKYQVFSVKKGKKKKFLNLKSNFYGNISESIKLNNNLRNCRIIFVCSKYPFLSKHLKKIKNNNQIIVPLLNGILHYDILNKKYKNVFIANIGKVIAFRKKNLIIHNSKNTPEVIISKLNKKDKDIKLIKKILKNILVNVKFYRNDNFVLWNKLIRIAGISTLTAIYNNNLGQIRKSKQKFMMLKQLLKEIIFVINKLYKTKFKLKKIMDEIKKFPNNLTTSLQRDISLGKKSEVETQIGAIYNIAKKNNIKCLKITKAYNKIKLKCK